MQKTMLFRRSLLAITVAAGLSGCSSLPDYNGLVSSAPESSEVKQQSLPAASIPYSKFVLDNGLTVIVHEDRKAPVVAVNIWYKVGSKDEQLGKTGFAHLFEHLMFNGSENYKGDFFEPFLTSGATDMNGTTNNDRTNYFATVPTQALDMALWMESDRMGHFKGAISQEVLDEQRGVVQNEKRQRSNRPYGKSWGYTAQDTFPNGHPYSWSVIGSMADLNAANIDDVKEWFSTYYGPSNAVLVLAGDIDEKTAREKAEKYFADIKPGPPLAKPDVWIAERTGEKRRVIQDRVTQPRIVKIWNTPPTGTQESINLDILSSVLGDGKSSRLYQRLVQNEQLATDASAFFWGRQMAGQFFVSVDAKPDADLKRIEMIIQEEMNLVLTEGLTQSELDKTRFSIAANTIRETERVGGFGGKSDILARGEVYLNDPGFYQKSADMLARTTTAAIQETAKSWLSDGVYTQTILPFPKYTAASEGADRSKLPEVKGANALALPKLQHATLDNGLKVVLVERTNTPLLNMRLQFNAGRASHQNYGAGVPDFTLSMLMEGTQDKDVRKVQSILNGLGSNITTSIGYDSSDLDVDALSVNMGETLSLLGEIVSRPAFSEESISRLRDQRLEKIASESVDPRDMIWRTLPSKLYDTNHPYAAPASGSGDKDVISRINSEALNRYYQDWIRPDNATLVVVGDTDLESLKASLNSSFSSWQAPSTSKPAIQYPDVNVASEPVVYLLDQPGASQSSIAVAQLLPEINDSNLKDDTAFNIFNDLLGGKFTSRINMNLREDKHWSYGARSYSRNTRDARPYVVSTSVQTDKTGPALGEIRKELSGILKKRPASQEEVQKYRDNRIQELAGRYETNARLLNAVSQMVINNQPDDYLQQYADILATITTDSVRTVGESRLKPEQMIWIVVGDLKKIEKEVRDLGIGKVEVIKPRG